MAKSTTQSTATSETPKVEVSKDEQLKADMAHAKSLMEANGNNKSAVIRLLLTEWGAKARGRIAKSLDIKYQFVRNVAVTPVGKKDEAPKSE